MRCFLGLAMDFDPTELFVTFVVSGVGFVFFSYGRKLTRAPQVIGGLLLMIFPYFVSGPLLIGLCGVVLVALIWLAVKLGW
jgi:hypothetical protein